MKVEKFLPAEKDDFKIGFYITQDMRQDITKICKKLNCSRADFLRACIKMGLDK